MDFHGGSVDKESACKAGDLDLIPGLGRCPGEGKGYLLTPVFWPGEFHGLYSSWGHKEWDMTEGLWDFPVAQMVKNLPAIQEFWVQSLGQEDLLKKG